MHSAYGLRPCGYNGHCYFHRAVRAQEADARALKAATKGPVALIDNRAQRSAVQRQEIVRLEQRPAREAAASLILFSTGALAPIVEFVAAGPEACGRKPPAQSELRPVLARLKPHGAERSASLGHFPR